MMIGNLGLVSKDIPKRKMPLNSRELKGHFV
jgi:hypothetical protein